MTHIHILDDVEMTADWRREKAEQFPDDRRNLEAAAELGRLAQEIRALEGSDLYRQVCQAEELAADHEDVWLSLGERDIISSALRDVGFRGGFGTATELLEWYRDTLREAIEEAMSNDDSTDLAEQVANDPTVKAAKQAYDDAYAKAYAEARKRL